MFYAKDIVDKIKESGDIRLHVPGADASKPNSYVKCPDCGKEGKNKGLYITQTLRKHCAKCFSCGLYLGDAIAAEMKFSGCEYVEAIERVASTSHITLPTEEKKSKSTKSFCSRQLEASGLTQEDTVIVLENEDGSKDYITPFRKGGVKENFVPDFDKDEMLIFYYDLYGKPVQYATRGIAGGLKDYFRIRWSNPAAHTDANGRPGKYWSAKGSSVKFFIPDKIRRMYRKASPIDTLIIQEGEKKAEKACKHGIHSIGIQGIYNIGNEESGLIQDLQYIVQRCQVKNVILLFDSDWDDLHSNLENGDNIDQRPNQFAKAAVKFRRYVETLHRIDLSVDVWIAHLNGKEKGIDDLLCGSLAGKEFEFLEDMKMTMYSHDGKGKYADFHKVSSLTDYQIMDLWHLRDRDQFFKIHKDKIDKLSTVRFGKVIYRKNEDGNFIQSSKRGADEEFWGITVNEKTKKRTPTFDTLAAIGFLEDNGFYRIHTMDQSVDEFHYVNIENGIVTDCGQSYIRDFIYRYALQNCKDKDILRMLTEKLSSLMGSDKLERLVMLKDDFDNYQPGTQLRSYKNGQIRITSNSIEFGKVVGKVWYENVIKRNFKRVKIFDSISKMDDGNYDIVLTPDGQNCEFLQYLRNTSNFWKERGDNLTDAQWDELSWNFVNKITSIGYLLTDYKYPSERKCIVAMDGKMSEVGTSNGRSGKSLIGDAISRVLEQEMIDGKALSSDDAFMFSSITPRTRNVFIDDVKVNFDIKRLFNSVTGGVQVNPKAKARFTIPFEKAPKFYITTNHAINDNSPSAMDRMVFILFSDWYNEGYSPFMEFGHSFFEDWDEKQWILFDNLMAECVMYYFKSMDQAWDKKGCGAVRPPMEDVKARTLRQKMGEAFLQWAETYFDPSGSNLNSKIVRLDMFKDFIDNYPGQSKFITSGNFKEKLIYFCEYSGLHLNPHKKDKDKVSFDDWAKLGVRGIFKGDRDVSGSKEYFTVASDEFAKNMNKQSENKYF